MQNADVQAGLAYIFEISNASRKNENKLGLALTYYAQGCYGTHTIKFTNWCHFHMHTAASSGDGNRTKMQPLYNPLNLEMVNHILDHREYMGNLTFFKNLGSHGSCVGSTHAK